MPKFLERKLKAEYGANSAVPYKVMNAIGAMRGNKETPKGAAMEAKHERKLHPKMQQRAAQVKASHAQLTKDVPGFAALSGREQIKATHMHATKALGKRYRLWVGMLIRGGP